MTRFKLVIADGLSVPLEVPAIALGPHDVVGVVVVRDATSRSASAHQPDDNTGLVGSADGLGAFVPPLPMGSLCGTLGLYGVGLERRLGAVARFVFILVATMARKPRRPRPSTEEPSGV